jgi:transcriptional regulator GlxA family with amidase domain
VRKSLAAQHAARPTAPSSLSRKTAAFSAIDNLAKQAGMGPRNFIRRFKAATGRVPGAYLQTLRVSAAKEPLEHGDASIQTVSSKIGYEDIGFFRNLFKRHTGMTPGEYRDNFRK